MVLSSQGHQWRKEKAIALIRLATPDKIHKTNGFRPDGSLMTGLVASTTEDVIEADLINSGDVITGAVRRASLL